MISRNGFTSRVYIDSKKNIAMLTDGAQAIFFNDADGYSFGVKNHVDDEDAKRAFGFKHNKNSQLAAIVVDRSRLSELLTGMDGDAIVIRIFSLKSGFLITMACDDRASMLSSLSTSPDEAEMFEPYLDDDTDNVALHSAA